MKARLAVAFAALGVLAWVALRSLIGDPAAQLEDRWFEGRRVLDRSGEVLRTLPSDLGQRGRPIPLDAMGDRLVVATIVSEDQRFFDHSGVDAAAVLRAVGQNVRHRRIVSGASTITQQLVKLLDHEGKPPGPGERTVWEKVQEAARAQNLEEDLDKDTILAAYLNRLSYGRGLVGPATASEAYFERPPASLSWAQAALLAVLPRAPSFLDPYRHLERAELRQQALLEALHHQGWLDDADLARALAEPLELSPVQHPFFAPHLTEALRQGRLGGLDAGDTQLSLDLALQREVETIARGHRDRLLVGGASSAAVLVVDNDDGEVLAYVGSLGWDDEAGQVDMVRARRQPGSTLKPFVYAMAFRDGLQPTEALPDVPGRFGGEGYAPDNFSGTFFGPVRAREALAGSLNVVAVRLAAGLRRGELLGLLHQAGFDSLDQPASHYGLSLALGSGEVTAWELAQAYSTLARGGVPVSLRVRLAPDGVAPSGERILPASAVAAVADALSDPAARVRGLGGRGPFDFDRPVAVKTGTSSGYRDAWTVGFSRSRTVVVWVGNADGAPTRELTGGRGAGPLFADVMARALDDVPAPRPLFDASLLEKVEVCALSGLPAGEACPHRIERRWLPTAGDVKTCALHRRALERDGRWFCHPRGQAVVALPDAYDDWLSHQPLGAPGHDPAGLPWLDASSLVGCGGDDHPRLEVQRPRDGEVLHAVTRARDRSQVELAATLQGMAAVPVVFELDGEVVARLSGPPYRAFVDAERGDHVLVVRPADPRVEAELGRAMFSVR